MKINQCGLTQTKKRKGNFHPGNDCDGVNYTDNQRARGWIERVKVYEMVRRVNDRGRWMEMIKV